MLSANHHLYADDTQLFLSFSACDFSQNIIHLESTISNISNWMSAYFLSLAATQTNRRQFVLNSAARAAMDNCRRRDEGPNFKVS
jgi:hypothetical protein